MSVRDIQGNPPRVTRVPPVHHVPLAVGRDQEAGVCLHHAPPPGPLPQLIIR
ncbi:hypothetical protein E2C01_067636 [Portunus trituberculatus]|uniref:Uncharacterized protein n=1 Tax=Portunus trituberculatus TaxID=210409 RepID=A0A5B7HPV4_PORTR|nr:hypothetical protein [Portunus trituberculatus]